MSHGAMAGQLIVNPPTGMESTEGRTLGEGEKPTPRKGSMSGSELFQLKRRQSLTAEERNLLPDTATLDAEKKRESLLEGVEQFPHHELTHVKPPEPMTGTEMLQQELTVKSISGFDSSALHATTTMDKTLLPDQDTIQKERTHMKHLVGISSFDHSDLTHVKHPEPLTGTELLEKELAIKSIPTFDSSALRATTKKFGEDLGLFGTILTL